MSKFIEIEEQISNLGLHITPQDYWRNSITKPYSPDSVKRLIITRISIINVEEIKCIIPTRFTCENSTSPIYPVEYRVILNSDIDFFISNEEYENKIKPVLFGKNLDFDNVL